MTQFPTTLLLGLVVGLLGSLADNALGGGGAVTALQVVLWVAGAILVALALVRAAPRRQTPLGVR
jgi:hypothetical protein